MAIEPTEFNVFGITVNSKHINEIRKAMENTYSILSDTNGRISWRNTEFCKREIVSLWGGIVEMLSTVSEEELERHLNGSETSDNRLNEFRNRLNVDRDNLNFIIVFGKQLMEGGKLGEILKQLQSTQVSKGSIFVRFKDTLTEKTIEARIEVCKMMKQIKKESRKIETALKHFVDWAKDNKRPIITCSLAAGVLLTSIVALSFVGGFMIPLIGVRLFILASLAILCTIYEIYGTFGTLKAVKDGLSRRVGLTLKEI